MEVLGKELGRTGGVMSDGNLVDGRRQKHGEGVVHSLW